MALKDELIKRLLETVYKETQDKETIEFLQSLSEDQLDDIINDYNLVGIITKNK